MSQNIGTLISAPIRPNDSNDPIASAWAKEIKGGLHVATYSSDRDAIIVQRREWGMMCYVIDDNQTYQLEYNYSSTDITDNSNWKPFSGSGGGGGGEWLDSVISFENVQPGSPSVGDRYILGNSPSGAVWGSLNPGDVVEFNSVSSWTVTQPTDGTSVRVDNEDNIIYRYQGVYPTGTWETEKESQVRYIDVTTSDGFAFTSTTTYTLSQYDKEVILLAKFTDTNIGSTASLNINSLGDVEIKKASGMSLVDIMPNDISTNYPHTLLYDGTYFILIKETSDNVSFNVQYDLTSTDHIIVPTTTQYWIYGDLDINGGIIENYGKVVITNGNLNFGASGGSFLNYNDLVFNTFAEIDGLGVTNYVPKWRTNLMLSATSSIYDDSELVQITGNTFSISTPNLYIPNGSSNGYVLTSDANGVATWQPSGGGGTVNKYSTTQSFTGGVTYSITHGLNTKDIVFNFWDENTGELITISVVRTGLNTVDVNSAVSISSGRIVIIGG